MDGETSTKPSSFLRDAGGYSLAEEKRFQAISSDCFFVATNAVIKRVAAAGPRE